MEIGVPPVIYIKMFTGKVKFKLELAEYKVLNTIATNATAQKLFNTYLS